MTSKNSTSTAYAIEAVLWDFGGVFTLSPFSMLAGYAKSVDMDPMLVGSTMFGDYYQDTDHPWHRLERGEISMEVAREKIIALGRKLGLPRDLDLYEAFGSFPSDGGLRTQFVQRAQQLRTAGYQLAIVTNNIAEYRDGWRALLPYPVDEVFHTVIDSSVEGIRKPNPAIFHLALERLGSIAPERSIFLDDFDGNTQAAAALGLHTVLVGEDDAAALAELDALLAERSF